MAKPDQDEVHDLVWWSASPGARKKAEEEFRKLPPEMQGRLLGTIERTLTNRSRPEDRTKLDQNIWEWRDHKGRNHFRVLYFTWGRYFVAVSAFYKNQQKVPAADLKRANARRKQWIASRGDKPEPDWVDS